MLRKSVFHVILLHQETQSNCTSLSCKHCDMNILHYLVLLLAFMSFVNTQEESQEDSDEIQSYRKSRRKGGYRRTHGGYHSRHNGERHGNYDGASHKSGRRHGGGRRRGSGEHGEGANNGGLRGLDNLGNALNKGLDALGPISNFASKFGNMLGKGGQINCGIPLVNTG